MAKTFTPEISTSSFRDYSAFARPSFKVHAGIGDPLKFLVRSKILKCVSDAMDDPTLDAETLLSDQDTLLFTNYTLALRQTPTSRGVVVAASNAPCSDESAPYNRQHDLPSHERFRNHGADAGTFWSHHFGSQKSERNLQIWQH